MSAVRDDVLHGELIEKAAQGDSQALDRLVEKYYRTVFSIGYARLRNWEQAEELAQEVFLRATLHLNSLRERQFFGPWLIRIARNVAEDWARKDQSRARVVTFVPLESLPAEPPDDERPSVRDQHLAREDERLVREAVLRLDPELREVVMLHFTEGLTKSDIARRLEVHPSSVARQLDRALFSLREDLGPLMGRAVQALQAPARGAVRTTAALAALFTVSEATRQSVAAATLSAAELATVTGAKTGETKSSAAAAGLLGKLAAFFGGGSTAVKTASVTAVAVVTLGAGIVAYRLGPKLRPVPFDEERFPLSPDATLLLEVPPMPSGPRTPLVYLAHTAPRQPDDQEAAEAFQSLLRFHLRSAPEDRLPLNILTRGQMGNPYRREDGTGTAKGRPRAEYLRDAAAFGSDFFIATEVEDSTDTIALGLTLTDLRTSRTASSTTVTAHRDFPRLLEDAVRTSALFCGLSEREIGRAGMVDGFPSAATWGFWRADGDSLLEGSWDRAIERDPECRALYTGAAEATGILRYANDGLKQWREDPRLWFVKAAILQNRKRHETAALFASELMRRYPENLAVATDLTDHLRSLYPVRPTPSEVPPAYRVTVDAFGNIARRLPHCYTARWLYGYAANQLAQRIRGCRQCGPAEEVPEELARLAQELNQTAAEEIAAARSRRPDSSSLLHTYLSIHTDAGYTDVSWQRGILEELYRLDNSNVGGAIYVAASHGLGGKDDEHYVPLLREAAERHRDQPRALARIGDAIGSDLSERLRRGLIKPEDIYRNRTPRTDLYVDCVERAIDGGIQVEKWMAGMLREMYRQRHGEGKVRELVESGKHWALTGEAAKEAHGRQEYEKSLRLARLALRVSTLPDSRQWLRYYVVRSLWKLKRHDEALREARAGIQEFPERQTFHYLFAVVALEKGDPLEEAYRHAKRAVDISTTNTGANETYRALRDKLGKPRESIGL